MSPSRRCAVCGVLLALGLLTFSAAEDCEGRGLGCSTSLGGSEESGLLQLHDIKRRSPTDCVLPPGMRVARTGAGFDMAVLGDDDVVSRYLFGNGWWEIGQPSELASPNATLPASGTFLDIGGNIGYYSLLFAHAGYKVLTVEPMTRNRAAIEASLCLNPQLRDRITVLPVALASPEQQSMKCVIRPQNVRNVGDGTMECGSPETIGACDKAAGCEPVPVKTLDNVLAEVNPTAVDMVKMDIEGFECKALQGGQSVFTRFRPHVFRMESKMSGSACLEQAAAAYGYSVVPKGVDTLIVKNL